MTVNARQNENRSIELLAAQRQLYSEAKAAHSARLVVTVGLAAVSPLVVLYWPAAYQGLGAVAGAWLLFSRLVLRPLEQRRANLAAEAQEEFDCYVLAIPRQAARRSPRRAATVAAARRHLRRKRKTTERRGRLADWYPDVGGAPAPLDAVICQQVNLAWSARLHREWANVLLAMVVGWTAMGIVFSLIQDLFLGEYLIAVFLPSLPALLEGIDVREMSRVHADERDAAEIEVHRVWDEAMVNPSTLNADRCRAVQDKVLALRRQNVFVPDWYYRLRKKTFEIDVEALASTLAEQAMLGEPG